MIRADRLARIPRALVLASGCLALAWLGTGARDASAKPLPVPMFGAESTLTLARDAYDDRQYAQVLSLTQILPPPEDTALDDIVNQVFWLECYLMRGFAQTQLGDTLAAVGTFKRALMVDADLMLNGLEVTPTIERMYARAGGKLHAPDASDPSSAKAFARPTSGTSDSISAKAAASTDGEDPFAKLANEVPASNALDRAWRSTLLPGWGQMYAGAPSSGAFWSSAAGLTLATALFQQLSYQSARQEYLEAGAADAGTKYAAYNTASKWARGLWYTLGVVWLANVADAAIFHRSNDAPGLALLPLQSSTGRVDGVRVAVEWRLK